MSATAGTPNFVEILDRGRSSPRLESTTAVPSHDGAMDQKGGHAAPTSIVDSDYNHDEVCVGRVHADDEQLVRESSDI